MHSSSWNIIIIFHNNNNNNNTVSAIKCKHISRYQISFDKLNNFSFFFFFSCGRPKIRWQLKWNGTMLNFDHKMWINWFFFFFSLSFSLTVLQFTDNRCPYVGCCANKSNSGLFYSLITMIINNKINHIYALFSLRSFRELYFFISSFSLFYSTFQFHILLHNCVALLIQFLSSFTALAFNVYSIFNSKMEHWFQSWHSKRVFLSILPFHR